MNTKAALTYRYPFRNSRIFPSLLAIGLLISSIWLAQRAGRIGNSRFMSIVGVASNEVAASDEAVRLNPGDPETHYDRARVLMNLEQPEEALREFEIATSLRKHDFYLWLEYGLALDQTGQENEALAAFERSIWLAPHFAEPHWQFGNLLFRLGRTEEAFAELRKAINSDHTRFESAVDLAFAASKGDAAAIQRLVQPQTVFDHLKLANFFARHSEAKYAVAEFDSAGPIDGEPKMAQFKQLVTNLINSKNFEEAQMIWAKGYEIRAGGKSGSATSVINGDFEEPISRDVIGFGWQLPLESPTLRISLDGANFRTGARSLLIDFRGENNPDSRVLFQRALVQPQRHYVLTFSAKTKDIVTGGLPIIGIYDINGIDRKGLVTSSPIQSGNSDWNDYSMKFATGEASKAVEISVERRPCASQPCPIFGQMWLDNFLLNIEP